MASQNTPPANASDPKVVTPNTERGTPPRQSTSAMSVPRVLKGTEETSQEMPISTPPTDMRYITGQIPAVKAANDMNAPQTIVPNPGWPPPMLLRPDTTPEERYYLENRWFSQWRYFDKRANENKKNYLFYQRIIIFGSVAVPVLVSLSPSVESFFGGPEAGRPARAVFDVITIFLSLAVALAAGMERLNKYGEYWSSYRQAAEELMQEKALYDSRAGHYESAESTFLDFVERVEQVIAQQNGRWIQSRRESAADAQKRAQGILSQYYGSTFNSSNAPGSNRPIPPDQE